jgi:hypothetical protein
MRFEFDQNYKKISEIIGMRNRGELIVDYSYQRKAVWGEKDWIRLVETILLNLVVPSVYFWNSETDPDTGKAILHIVDGQQRITAIQKFIQGEFKLKKSFLLEKESKERFGNKYFNDLLPDEKKDFWDYKLSVIEIAREVKIDDVKNMFKRLNLTDYNLNNQERRNIISGEFAALARELSENEFWNNDTRELFRANIVKRMQDVEFCASLILLYKRGIIDQQTDKALNDAYRDYETNYEEAEKDKEAVLKAMELVERFISEKTLPFLRRTSQLYTLFSVVFYIMHSGKDISEKEIKKFHTFVDIYDKFKNEENVTLDLTSEERNLYDLFKKYKQASSEGTRKQINRMARFDVLKHFILEDKSSDGLIESLCNKLVRL